MNLKYCKGYTLNGMPEIVNVYNATITRNQNGRYTISAKDDRGELYTNGAKFDSVNRFFYDD